MVISRDYALRLLKKGKAERRGEKHIATVTLYVIYRSDLGRVDFYKPAKKEIAKKES